MDRPLSLAAVSVARVRPTPLARLVCWLGASALLIAAQGAAWAQDYPSRVITFKSGIAPGSTVDGMAREVAQSLTERIGQRVVVEPVPGAGGLIAAQRVIASPPDGYTFLFVSNGLISNQAMRAKPQLDLGKDLMAISPLLKGFFGLYVNSEMPVRNLAEFIAYAKARPGTINYATTGTGGIVHLVTEAFKIRSGVDIVHVPYKGGSELMPELIANRVQVNFSDIPFMQPQLDAGKVRLLAVTSPQRLARLPDVPTFEELGFKGFTPTFWVGLYAPPGTPSAVVEKVNGELKAILTTPQTQQRYAERGYQTVWMPATEAQRAVVDEFNQMNRTIDTSRIERQ